MRPFDYSPPKCCSMPSVRFWTCLNTFGTHQRRLRAAQLPGASGGVAFLKTFGKPDRLLTCECERSESTTLAQAFQMINGETVRKKLEMASNRIGQYLKGKLSGFPDPRRILSGRGRAAADRSSDRPSPRISEIRRETKSLGRRGLGPA